MERMDQILKKILTCGFIAITGSLISAQAVVTPKDKPEEKSTKTKVTVQTDDERQLLADKVTVKKQVAIADSLALLDELEEEELLFPADDLYEIWDTKSVNPYAKNDISIPDSFNIDLTSFVMPFEGRVTSKYGPRRRRMHYGTDIKVEVGDTIVAAFSGKVRVKYYQRRGYGYYLVLRHPNGLETVYGHLSQFLVDVDDVVEAGQPIALGGNTGRSTGSHLHFETRFLGKPINPADIIDFDNFVTHTDTYTFTKTKWEESVASTKKYAKAGKGSKGGNSYYKVRKGDTLGKIAQRYGTTVTKLCRLNNIKSTTTLSVGRTIRCS